MERGGILADYITDFISQIFLIGQPNGCPIVGFEPISFT